MTTVSWRLRPWPWLGALIVGLTAAGLRADDWPQFRGPNRDAVWHEGGILQTFPPEGLPFRWRVPVGPGFSSPVVWQGRVFLTDCHLADQVAEERVLCFDEVSGRLLWCHRYGVNYPEWVFSANGDGPRATPIVQGGQLFTVGALGNLFCLDAVAGEVLWEKNLAIDYQVQPFSGITASPLIEDGLLILYICGKPEACVVAFDLKSGAEAWRALDDGFTYSSPIILAAGGERQLIVWTQEAVTSLEPTTGKTFWRVQVRTPGDMAVSTPVCRDNLLLISGLMLKLDLDKPGASVLWPGVKPASKRIFSNTSTALIQDGHVFAGTTLGKLVCCEASTGHQVWETTAVTASGNGSSIHLTPNGDSVLLFTDQGNLIRARLAPAGYEELSRVHLLKPTTPFFGKNVVWPPPAYANGHVFARNSQELACASLTPQP